MMEHMMKPATLLFPALACLISVGSAAENMWYTDYDAAVSRARAENKPIILDFTGSDWCGWCIAMRRQVFDTPAFLEYAGDKFILLEVDLPHNTSHMTEEQLRRNRQLVERYGVTTFPSVLVITPDGTLTGGFSGGRLDMPSITQTLNLARDNAELLRKAAALSGLQRAHVLKMYYRNMPGVFRRTLYDLRREIADLDPENETGIHTELQDIRTVDNTLSHITTLDESAAIDYLIGTLSDVTNAHKGELTQVLCNLLNERIFRKREQADSLEDIESIRQDNLLLIRHCLPPESHDSATRTLNHEYRDPTAMLEELRRERSYREKYKK